MLQSLILRVRELQLGLPGGAWAAWAVVAVAIALVVAGLAELSAVAGRARRGWLASLRVCTALGAALVVLQPQWVTREVERVEGKLAVLADVSRSMSVRMDGRGTRAELAREVIDGWRRSPLKPLAYAFGDETRAADLSELARAYPARDGDTLLGDALAQVALEQGQALGGIVVLSDGHDLSGTSVALRARDLGVRVHTVLVGEVETARDDAIVRVKADPVAFLRQEAQVEVSLRRVPAGAGSIMVSLRRGGELVRELEAEIDADGRGRVTIPFPITSLGRSVYTVSIPLSGSDGVPENNERAFLVNATRDRLRVLLVCGHPSWDARFLRAFLKDNPGNDLITFFILRTPSDMSMASQDELSLIPFPTDELFREHLDSFDLVIFQDFDFGPYQMARYLPRVRDFVLQGGAFAMIGGDRSFGAGQYDRTPLAEVLPVDMVPGTDAVLPAAFRPRVAEGMNHHPIVELLPDPLDNARAWAELAPVPGQNRLRGLRPGAHALLVHPDARGDDGQPMVTLAVGEAGKGRVMALAVDGSWRWGMATAGARGDASAYERFWDRVVRWLARDPMLDPSRISLDRERYAPQGAVGVSLSLRDARHVPMGLRRVEVAVLDDDDVVLAHAEVTTDLRGAAGATLAAPAGLGGYRVAVRTVEEAGWLVFEGFVVEAGGDELADPRADADSLQALSAATGGQYFTAEAAPRLDALDRSRSQQLGVRRTRPFATPWFFALLVSLMSLEWVLRRRWGLR